MFLWWLADEGLRDDVRGVIVDPSNSVSVSAATAWEVAIKTSLGKLSVPGQVDRELVEANGFQPLPITLEHAVVAGQLPRHHDDPFDRMLVAQAQIEGLRLVTSDRRLTAYGISVLGLA